MRGSASCSNTPLEFLPIRNESQCCPLGIFGWRGSFAIAFQVRRVSALVDHSYMCLANTSSKSTRRGRAGWRARDIFRGRASNPNLRRSYDKKKVHTSMGDSSPVFQAEHLLHSFSPSIVLVQSLRCWKHMSSIHIISSWRAMCIFSVPLFLCNESDLGKVPQAYKTRLNHRKGPKRR
jgi:hypothetical protein